MDHPKKGIKEAEGRIVGFPVNLLGYTIDKARFNRLQIPGAEIVPEKLVNCHQGIRNAEFRIVVLYGFNNLAETSVKPFHGDCGCLFMRCVLVNLKALYESIGVPDLVTEVPPLLHLAFVIEDVIAGG